MCDVNSNTVTYIDLATKTRGENPITVGMWPSGIAITPDGLTAYVCNNADNTVTYIDLATKTPGENPIAIGMWPAGIAIAPDGNTAYVCNAGGATVAYIDLDTKTPGENTIAVGSYPGAIAITPDGSTAYVCNRSDGTVTYIDLVTKTPGEHTIAVGQNPAAIAITPDGETAYVCNGDDDTVTYIDLATKTPGERPITTVGSHPTAIAIAPDLAPTALFSCAVSGSTVAFDASGSSASVGTIASYTWDFGDGQTETTSSSTASHTYSTSGTMTAILKVTNTVGLSTETSQQVSIQILKEGIALFKGKVHRHHKPYMSTGWSTSTLPNTTKYRIFAHDRKIATIKVRHEKQKTIHLHPKHHRVGSKKYCYYLENKYNIRAVDSLGQVSQPTFVRVRKS